MKFKRINLVGFIGIIWFENSLHFTQTNNKQIHTRSITTTFNLEYWFSKTLLEYNAIKYFQDEKFL